VTLRRLAAVGHRSEYARGMPPFVVSQELIQQLCSTHATFVSALGLPLPPLIREVQRREGMESAYVVTLWSKEKLIGGLVVGCRTAREFTAADISLLIAVGSQIANAIDRSRLYLETRQAYENLRRTQEQLLHSEKLAAVGQLISGVAHELNNPLTAILGYSQLLTSGGEIGPRALGYVDKVYKQAQRTHRIVQNLLSFARQHKPERAMVRLNSVIEDTLALRDYDLRMSQIQVSLELDENLPEVPADPHQLQQVFLNLINNAVDAMLEVATLGELRVRSGAEERQVFIEFTDSGPGVKDASRVFDPFYTTKPVGKGTGLGLSICYGIVTEHGGRILVRNGAQGGATFRIELPLPARERAADAEKPAAERNGKNGRILIVAADKAMVKSASRVWIENDHVVATAVSMIEARKLMTEREFDLVVADWEEAQREGATQDGQGLGQKVLWMVGAAEELNGAEWPRKSMMIQKPFAYEELLAAVEAGLVGSALIRE